MASYTEDTLTQDETILFNGRIALRKYWMNFAIGGLFLLGCAIMLIDRLMGTLVVHDEDALLRVNLEFAISFMGGLLWLAPPLVRAMTNELVLTNKRVVAKVGIVSFNAFEIRLDKVESVTVKQGLLGKLLNYGTIVVAGAGATHAAIPAIVSPVIFKRQFNSAVASAAA